MTSHSQLPSPQECADKYALNIQFNPLSSLYRLVADAYLAGYGQGILTAPQILAATAQIAPFSASGGLLGGMQPPHPSTIPPFNLLQPSPAPVSQAEMRRPPEWRTLMHVKGEHPCNGVAFYLTSRISRYSQPSLDVLRIVSTGLEPKPDMVPNCGGCGQLVNVWTLEDLDWEAHVLPEGTEDPAPETDQLLQAIENVARIGASPEQRATPPRKDGGTQLDQGPLPTIGNPEIDPTSLDAMLPTETVQDLLQVRPAQAATDVPRVNPVLVNYPVREATELERQPRAPGPYDHMVGAMGRLAAERRELDEHGDGVPPGGLPELADMLEHPSTPSLADIALDAATPDISSILITQGKKPARPRKRTGKR